MAAMIVEECLARIEEMLEASELSFGHGTDNAGDEAYWLLHSILYGARDFAEIPPDMPVTEGQWSRVRELLDRRINERKPLAYLLKEAWFCGLPFHVDERVLVPRSPIAELIQNGFEPFLAQPPADILDLCTGSGCIGIACADAFPEARAVLSDCSEDALAVAQQNITRHGQQDRVSTQLSDVFDSIVGRFDLIVSNPPYVSAEEYAGLPDEYVQEPRLGLVCGENGLAIPLRILRQAAGFLNDDGLLILEVGNNWQALEEAVPDLPLLWLDFEFGGHGVCALHKSELMAYL